MFNQRRDPGPCPICGAAHTACTTQGPAGIVIDQLPAKTAALAALEEPPVAVPDVPPPVEFSTATYERAKHKPKGR
jgi:hypothetical protein